MLFWLRSCSPHAADQTSSAWKQRARSERLIEALDDDLDVAIAAVEALGRLGAPTALGPLFNKTAAGVRQPLVLAAIEALGAYGNPDAAARLILVLSRNDEDLCEPVMTALAQTGAPAVDPLVTALRKLSPDPEDEQLAASIVEAVIRISNEE